MLTLQKRKAPYIPKLHDSCLPIPGKILMTTDTVGGVWTYALELIEALQVHGVSVALATMGAPLTIAQQQAAARLPNLELFESTFKLEWMEAPWADVWEAGEWLLHLAATIQPDLIHLNGYTHAVLPWPCPVIVAAHSCVLSWWQAVKGTPAPANWKTYRQAVTAGLHAAGLVVAPSQAMLSALEQYYGPLQRGVVAPNGRNPAHFAPGPKANFIFTAGRLWDEAKNVATLAKVAPAVAWPIYAAGDSRIASAGGNLNLEASPSSRQRPALHLTGLLSSRDIALWYRRAAIYALPARYEPFGLSILEAGLSGCALVLGDIPSLRENWDGAAIFVPPDDPDAITAALQWLMVNREQREALGRSARNRGLLFSPQNMARYYLALYADLSRHIIATIKEV